ncbi:hypothetical protein ACLQ3H_16115 [Micromonospora saelicesensis]|uniref:hypothetical protein n=1 Tax=Micromonospora saelicesensis TaxID=285676 RepID=UPI003CFAD559
MRFHKSRLWLTIAVAAAVLVFAVALLVSRSVIDALLMIAIVAALTGLYHLRRYARAVLLYRRRWELRRRHPDGEPVSSVPVAGRRDVTASGATSVAPGRRVRNRR